MYRVRDRAADRVDAFFPGVVLDGHAERRLIMRLAGCEVVCDPRAEPDRYSQLCQLPSCDCSRGAKSASNETYVRLCPVWRERCQAHQVLGPCGSSEIAEVNSTKEFVGVRRSLTENLVGFPRRVCALVLLDERLVCSRLATWDVLLENRVVNEVVDVA